VHKIQSVYFEKLKKKVVINYNCIVMMPSNQIKFSLICRHLIVSLLCP